MDTHGQTPCSRVQGGLAVGVNGDELAVDDAGPRRQREDGGDGREARSVLGRTISKPAA